MGVRRGAGAIVAGDSVTLHADARVVRDTVGPDVQDGSSGARAGRRACGATRAVLGRGGRRTGRQEFTPVLTLLSQLFF